MDERGLDELFESRVKGARSQRARTTVAGILVCALLLTGGVYGVRRLRQSAAPGQSTAAPTEAVTEVADEPATELTAADATEAPETPTEPAEQSTGETATAETPTGDAAAVENPTGDKTDTAENPTGDRAGTSETPTGDAATAETPTGETPTEAAGDPTEAADGNAAVSHRLTIYWPEEGSVQRPDNVYIKVLHEGEEVAFLELNERKGWTVSWTDTYPVRQLDLKSNLPEELGAQVRVDGNDFTVTVGSQSAADGLSAPTGEGGKLPQTGVNRTTPGKLALTGIGFLAVGLTMKRREQL